MKRGKKERKEGGKEEGKAMQPSCTEPNPMGKEQEKEERRKENLYAKVAKGQESV